jgi:cytochrome c oxidase subunit 2
LLAAVLLLVAGAPWSLADDGGPRTFGITASRFKYQPDRIEVRQGETVRLVIHSADTDHGLSIPAYKVKALVPKGGAKVTLEFVADRPGRFRIECSEYCGPGHMQMRGELVVTRVAQ